MSQNHVNHAILSMNECRKNMKGEEENKKEWTSQVAIYCHKTDVKSK